MRKINEQSMHLIATFQQISYIAMVAAGAMMVSKGEMSFGALIAASILSGKILSPVAGLTTQLVQWGHAKSAMKGLDDIWRLQTDHGTDQPVILEKILGNFKCESVDVSMNGKPVLSLPSLSLRAGEKVGVIGSIGAGKTTLLRTLSGMYKPQQGRVLLDDVDMSHLSKPLLAENMGYLPQDGRLVAGTLRDNLLLGLSDPGDEAILAVAKETGLMHSVVAVHPMGLAQTIPEGGGGLSGGQRQLINLTRVLLRFPKIWLLDEPTSALDRALEVQTIAMLKKALKPEDTLILVTHKIEMFSLVDRLIVMAGGRVVMDGPRDQVLAHLKTPG
jgi:ATP-binding cassette subfamily C protein LapB